MALRKKIVEGGLIFSLVFALSAIAFGQQTTTMQTEAAPQTKVEKKERKFSGQNGKRGQRGKFARRAKLGRHVLGKLNLTDAQKEQMRALHKSAKEKFAPQREELRTLVQKKRQGTITADEQERLDALKQQLKTSGQQMREQMNAILTTEQKQQLEQMKEQIKQRREEMRKRFEERRKQQPSTDNSPVE
jgi:Spy/CpxP family protein refolding chaperone